MEIKEFSIGNNNSNENYVNFINKHRAHATNLESFKWQFSYMPQKTVVAGIVENQEVFGSQCMMPIEVNYKNKKVISGKCENSYLDESLRGKNYFTKLFSFSTALCEEKKMELLWAFTPALKPYSRLGFKVYEDILISALVFIKTPSIKRFFAKRKGFLLIKGIPVYFLAIVSSFFVYLMVAFGNKILKTGNVSVKNNLEKDDDIELLNQELHKNYPSLIYIDHSKQFLDWRVFNNPNIDASSIYFYIKEKLVGYCLYSEKKGSVIAESLVYFDKSHLNGILLALVKFFQKNGIVSITYKGNYENDLNREIFLAIKKYSFRKINRSGLSFVYKFSNENTSESIDKGNWFINNLWTEGY